MKLFTYWILAILAGLSLLMACEKSNDLSDPDPDDDTVNYVLEEMATGAALKAANGIDIGPNGNLYVASVNGLEFVEMDKQNGTIINRFGLEMGVQGPDDLVFGPDNSIYWTDILTGEVGRLTPDGVVTKQFVSPGVNPIAFSTEGRLFVALDFLGDGLYELDPNLVEAPRPIIQATESNPFPLGFFNSFDFGADGRLYGPLFAAGLVISVDVDRVGDPTADPFVDGSVQVIAGGFVNPAAAKFGPDGMLTVLDQTGEVFKIDTVSGEKQLFANLEPGLDNMVFDTDGTLYMTNNDQGWVAEISSSGESRIISPGGMIAPQGLAVFSGANNEDEVFVADLFNLRQFNGTSGMEENIYKGYLIPEDESSLVLPMNLSRDGDNLIVASWFSGGVQVWDPQANQVLESYTLAAPVDAVRFQDDILVSDIGLGGVVRASDNSMVLAIDNTTVFAPGGLATDGTSLWVADWGAGNILEINFTGSTPNEPVVVASGLSNPEGLALDQDGNLLVVQTGAAMLSLLNFSTGEVTTVVEGLELSKPGLPGFPPTWLFDGVDVGQSGNIYLTGGGKNVLYRISQD